MYQFFKQLVLPPLGPLLLMAVGWGLRRHWRTGALLALWLGAVAFYVTSAPYFSARLLAWSEAGVQALDLQALPPGPGAIVVLSAGLNTRAPEYGGVTVDVVSLERLRYGALLERATGLPVLVSGGQVDPDFGPLSGYMRDTLASDYGIETIWLEDRSHTTAENAENAAEMLREKGITTVFLVSSAFHLRRAVAAFARAGIGVVPAPTGFTEPVPLEPIHLLPSPKGLQLGYFAVHEMVGSIWYAVRPWF